MLTVPKIYIKPLKYKYKSVEYICSKFLKVSKPIKHYVNFCKIKCELWTEPFSAIPCKNETSLFIMLIL